MKNAKKKITFLLLAIAVVAVLVGGFLFFSRLEEDHDKAPEGAGTAASRLAMEMNVPLEEAPEILTFADEELSPVEEEEEEEETVKVQYYKGQEYRYNDALSCLMILGIDNYGITESSTYYNDGQADFILLAVFDHDNKTCTLIQINRDTMADVPVLDVFGHKVGYIQRQIALAHTFGKGLEDSCENTEIAVSRLLYDVDIDNYFALTMDAIPILNDLVGGVTVTIEDDFTGIDDTLVKGETVTLDADNVEHYVRSRYSMQDDPTNIARMRRQGTYLASLFSALTEAVAKDSSFVMNAYSQVDDYLVTDCTIDEMSDYSEQFSGYTLSEIISPEGESVKGEVFMEFYVDEPSLQQLVIETFYTPAEEAAE